MFCSHPKYLTERSFKNEVITFHNGRVSWNSPSGQKHGVTSTVGLEDGAKSKCDNRCGR